MIKSISRCKNIVFRVIVNNKIKIWSVSTWPRCHLLKLLSTHKCKQTYDSHSAYYATRWGHGSFLASTVLIDYYNMYTYKFYFK